MAKLIMLLVALGIGATIVSHSILFGAFAVFACLLVALLQRGNKSHLPPM